MFKCSEPFNLFKVFKAFKAFNVFNRAQLCIKIVRSISTSLEFAGLRIEGIADAVTKKVQRKERKGHR